MDTMKKIDIEAELEFSASVGSVPTDFSETGFNKYGVRENVDEDGKLQSIDVLYRAMEPGLRKNIRISPEFLQTVVDKFGGPLPFQLDHSKSQLANVGTITRALFADALYLVGNIPNTGSQLRSDVISDFRHDPPAITDGSVGFGHDYEIEYNEDADEYEFVSAQLREFSLTPFPAGYDNGGLSAAFSDEFASVTTVDDGDESPEKVGEGQSWARISHAKITEF